MKSSQVNAEAGVEGPVAIPLKSADKDICWGSGDCTAREPSRTSLMLQRRHQDGCASKRLILGPQGWVAWARVYDVERHKTPDDPRLHH